MDLLFNYYNLSLFLGGLVALLSGAAVYFTDYRKNENRAWMLLNISTAVWSFGYFGMITRLSVHDAIVSNWILHSGAILIPLFYLAFIIALTKSSVAHAKIFYVLIPVALFFLWKNMSPEFVTSVFSKGPFAFAPNAGPLYGYFTFYFFATVIYALTILSERIRVTFEQERVRLRYVLFSSLAGFIGGGFVFFLTFNIQIPPYPIVLFTFYPVIIAYAMLRHKLFDVKVAATEILTGAMWVALLFRTLLAENITEQLVTGTLLIFTVIFGLLLIRNVYREVEQRERIEKLAKELEKTNAQLEVANERLKELDKLKTEFVSLATHQIRGPITAIKGYASMLLEGDFGEMPSEVRQPVETILESSSSLAGIVQDFLDISRIEQGRMKYEFTDLNLSQLVQEVARELAPNIEKKGLRLLLTIEPNIIARADAGKMKQVIENLLDNAQKYTPVVNVGERELLSSTSTTGHTTPAVSEYGTPFIKGDTPKGSITIRLRNKDAKIIELSVQDTGIGISKETLPKLFQKFSRAEDASKANMKGTGLGLYVARQLVEAQHGKIWAESEGAGKGAAFFVELPIGKGLV